MVGFLPPGQHPPSSQCGELAALADLPVLSDAQVQALEGEAEESGRVFQLGSAGDANGRMAVFAQSGDDEEGMPLALLIVRSMCRMGNVPQRSPPPQLPAAAGAGTSADAAAEPSSPAGAEQGGGTSRVRCAVCGASKSDVRLFRCGRCQSVRYCR